MENGFELSLQCGGTSDAFTFEGGSLMIGRDPSCEVVIDAEGVELHHASLMLEGTKIQVEDLTGGHKTFVNGYDISGRVEVECPATVQMGPAVLRVKVVEAAPDAHKAESGRMIFTMCASPGGAQAEAAEPTEEMLLGMGPRSASVQVRYALGKEIARGGMGRIYTGEDPQLKRVVAVKVSNVSSGGDPRFAREAEVLGNLPHPNIIPIHAMGEDEDGFPFYSMKLVKGQTLKDVIRHLRDGDAGAKKTYTRVRLLTVFRKICDAMAFAHSKGILHRDLKPENVMVGEFGEVLVMDWGLAKKMGEKDPLAADGAAVAVPASGASEDFGLTLDGQVVGTPQYMSPEQAEGRLIEIDERADIYSMGAILYSILTLRPPVEADTLDELLSKVKSGQITSMTTKRSWVESGKKLPGKPQEMGAEVPEALRAVTRKAMSLEKEKRYQTVEEFAADIDAYLSGRATQAEHAGALRQLVLLMQRHKSVTALLVLILIGAAAFTVQLIASERVASENAYIAEENAKKAAKERENARGKAAEANLALVEAAERDLDGEEMQRRLAEVPKDLRDQKWEYLNAKLESAEVSAEAKDNSHWTAMVQHPQKPGVLVTLQANGWVRTLDLKKQGGGIEDLCRVDTTNLNDVLALSRDGSKAAVLRHQKDKGVVKASLIEVVQLAGGKKIAELKLPPVRVMQLTFSADGASLLCVYKTQSEEVWHVEMRNFQNAVQWERANEFGVWAEISEKGEAVHMYSERTGTERNGILILDAKTGALQRTLARPGVWGPFLMSASAQLSSTFVAKVDCTSVVGIHPSGRFLRRYETATGKLIFENRVQGVNTIAALPDSGIIVTLGQRSDRCVVLQYWHQDTGLLVKSMPLLGNMKGGWRLVVHPKTGDVAVVNGKKLRAWNFQPSKPVTTLMSQSRGFDFLGEPWRLARISGNGSESAVEIFDTRLTDYLKKPLAVFKSPELNAGKLVASKDGAVVAVKSHATGKVRFYRRKGNTYEETFKGSPPFIPPNWALNADGSRLWTGAGVYDTISGKEVCRMNREGLDVPQNVSGASDWVDGKTIVEIVLIKADWEGAPEDAVERAMVLWDAETGARTLRVDAPDANGLCISPDGRQICEAGNDMRLRLRNGKTLAVEREFRAHDAPISDVEWHPKLPLLVSSSEDLTVRVWNLNDGHLVEELHGIASQAEQRAERVAWSPDGRTLAVAAGGNQTVGFYEMASTKPKPQAGAPAPPKPAPVPPR
ncbi:MAG: pTyr [Verrucomicrobia bacterium]|nr:MAG: pTyr [Verrucomicrobiota bacterium]